MKAAVIRKAGGGVEIEERERRALRQGHGRAGRRALDERRQGAGGAAARRRTIHQRQEVEAGGGAEGMGRRRRPCARHSA